MFIGIFQLRLCCDHWRVVDVVGSIVSVNAVFTWPLLRAVAPPKHRDEIGAVEQPVQQPFSHDGVRKERIEIRERTVGGQQQRAAPIPPAPHPKATLPLSRRLAPPTSPAS